MPLRISVVLSFLIASQLLFATMPSAADIGVYYFPGWNSKSEYWNDLKGLSGSRSPGKPWPEREPLLGYYPEEEIRIAEKHIDWASQYGIEFFAYDWYWNGEKTYLDHALNAHLKARNRNDLKFCVMWANHSAVPNSQKEFDGMVSHWINNLFAQESYYRVESKPVVFIYSPERLDSNAYRFGEAATRLLKKADVLAKKSGLKGIYFVAITNSRPDTALEETFLGQGFSAYTGWNYVAATDKSKSADYISMVDTYIDFYNSALKTDGQLPYLVTVSPGWDSRPWDKDGYYRENSTPEKFARMLKAAKKTIESQKKGPKILMIEAWNEFCEGSYIEPTKKWGMQYLEAIKKVFFKE